MELVKHIQAKSTAKASENRFDFGKDLMELCHVATNEGVWKSASLRELVDVIFRGLQLVAHREG